MRQHIFFFISILNIFILTTLRKINCTIWKFDRRWRTFIIIIIINFLPVLAWPASTSSPESSRSDPACRSSFVGGRASAWEGRTPTPPPCTGTDSRRGRGRGGAWGGRGMSLGRWWEGAGSGRYWCCRWRSTHRSGYWDDASSDNDCGPPQTRRPALQTEGAVLRTTIVIITGIYFMLIMQ